MLAVMKKILYAIFKAYNVAKGRRYLTIKEINASTNEIYHFHLENGGIISLHCVETIFEMVYYSSWIRNELYRVYEVSGTCNEYVPELIANMLKEAFYTPNLLPVFVSAADQKKAAIQAYVSMIAKDLRDQHSSGLDKR
jgi:hypothetical protein